MEITPLLIFQMEITSLLPWNIPLPWVVHGLWPNPMLRSRMVRISSMLIWHLALQIPVYRIQYYLYWKELPFPERPFRHQWEVLHKIILMYPLCLKPNPDWLQTQPVMPMEITYLPIFQMEITSLLPLNTPLPWVVHGLWPNPMLRSRMVRISSTRIWHLALQIPVHSIQYYLYWKKLPFPERPFRHQWEVLHKIILM